MPTDRTPYPGLRSFKREETDIFFGRDDCVDAMVERLAAKRFLAVLGSSGTGKSSLVNTGLLAGLEMGLLAGAGSRWRVVDFRPGDSPLRNLAGRALRTAKSAAEEGNSQPDEVAVSLLRARFNRGPRSLIEWCQEGNLPAGTNLLLLVDQFEELFRYQDYAGREEAEAFVALLLESRHPTEFETPDKAELPIYVVLTMRSEYLGFCSLFEDLAEAINEGAFLTPRMTREQCREAIVGPAKVCGVEIEPALVARLLNDLATFAPWDDDGAADQLNRIARRADQLPLLQYTLNRMWARARQPDGQPVCLSLSDYNTSEGLSSELNAHAEEICNDLGKELRPTIEAIFRALTAGTTAAVAVRRLTTVEELVSICNGNDLAVHRVLDAFRAPDVNFVFPECDPRSPKPLAGNDHIDLSHESLIRQWRTLAAWVEREGQEAHRWVRLKEDAELYAGGNGELLRGLELQSAVEFRDRQKPNAAWAQRYGNALDATLGFLAECQEADRNERAKRREEAVKAVETRERLAANRRVARLAGFAAVALAIVAVAAIWLGFKAGRLADEAGRLADQAQAQRNSALSTQSRFLADLANQSIKNGDAGTGMLLALEALLVAHDGTELSAVEAEAALLNAHQHLQEFVLLKGHTGWVTSAVFDEAGERVVTSSRDKTARVWDATTGKELARFAGHEDALWTAAFNQVGDRVVTASEDKTARIWDVATRRIVQTLKGHAQSVETAVFSPDGKQVLTASTDGTARIWDIDTGEIVVTFKGHTDVVWSAEFSRDGKRVVTASRDQTARIWDAETGALVTPLLGHEDSVWLAIFSRDGKRVATASRDWSARIWDAENGKEIQRIEDSDDVGSVAFNHNGSRVATISRDRKVRIWDVETGDVLRIGDEVTVRDGHADWIMTVAFSSDGKRIVTGSRDHTARIWDAETNKTISGLAGNAGPVSSAAFSLDTRYFVTAPQDHTAGIWEVESGKALATLKEHTDVVWSANFSPNATRVVTASKDTTARLWNAETGEPLRVLSGHLGPVWSAAFSPDGLRVVTASRDKTARIWSVESGAKLVELRGHDDDVLSAAFSSDGESVVTASRDHSVRVWNPETGHHVALEGHWDDVVSAVFRPRDRRRVATASTDRTARIWDVDTRREVAVLNGHTDAVWSVAFSVDGLRVVTASRDKTARIWDAETGRLLKILRGHTDWVINAAFRPNGHVVTVSRDKTARIWDAETGKELSTLEGHPTTQSLINRAKEVAPRCLSRGQREQAFLNPEPPNWCVEREKWPYHAGEWTVWLRSWQQWLNSKAGDGKPPLPGTPEWEPWHAARKP